MPVHIPSPAEQGLMLEKHNAATRLAAEAYIERVVNAWMNVVPRRYDADGWDTCTIGGLYIPDDMTSGSYAWMYLQAKFDEAGWLTDRYEDRKGNTSSLKIKSK
ncbi:hypothetical protein HQ524_02555 [Candidatus Uhrbacteria bacterium]|nr:hypothetical protein [Candidatus Uhrbacteria bacterium]